MAKKGIEYACYGKLGENGTYTGGKYFGPSSTFNGSPTVSEAKDFGDNRQVVTDNSVTGGTLSVELNERTLEIYADVLGHTLDADKKTVTYKADDIAPFVGVGAVGTSKTENNKHVYTGKFYPKVQFKDGSDENATKQESTAFTHTTIEGNIFVMEDGIWKEEKEFDTLTEAKAWVNGKVGITPPTPPSGS